MTEEQNQIEIDEVNTMPILPTRPITKVKRDIFRFNGERTTAINFEHITNMSIEGKKITFNFHSTSIFTELNDEATAASLFEALLNIWAYGVCE